MTLPPPKVCQRIGKLFAQMGSAGKDADVGRRKLDQLLLSWNDLPKILADIEPENSAADPGGSSGPAAASRAPDVLELARLRARTQSMPRRSIGIAYHACSTHLRWHAAMDGMYASSRASPVSSF
jgi:hypothetical protein